MKKTVITLILLLLICTLSFESYTVKAGISANIYIGMNHENFQTIRVNQPLEFGVIAFDGTPPYTYQWCTQTWDSIWGSSTGSVIEVSGATSSIFNFVSSTPGVYSISVKIWDSAGNYSNIVGLPTGVWVTVQAKDSNPIIVGTPNATIMIQSPINKTYNQNNITFAYTIESDMPPLELFHGELGDYFISHGVVLDYDVDKLIDLIVSTNLPIQIPNSPSVTLSKIGDNLYGGNTTLTNLSQGNHNVTVWLTTEEDYISYGIEVGYVFNTVSFSLDSVPPNVLILSPQTKTYNTSAVSLNFTISKPFSKLSYSLDGKENITLTENVTLTDLSNGNHSIIVYATDFAGNVGSSETSFTVDKAEPESFPTISVTASIGIVALVIASILAYFKKHRHRLESV